MAQFIDDDVDYEAYLAEPEAKQKVKPASYWANDDIAHELLPEEQKGAYLPWPKTNQLLRLRTAELTLWPGINGHGKSLVLGQIMVGVMAQGEKVFIASMEMRPHATLARMRRQAWGLDGQTMPQMREFHRWTDDRLWLYDHIGAVQWRNLIAVMRYCAAELQINHYVVDSLMRCGIREDDYNGQKDFVDALATFKHDYNTHVHLVMHSRKRDDEMHEPGKFDAKGTGTMTDLADNVVSVWRNKRKERAMEAGDKTLDTVEKPDALLICDKQRNGDWEGRIALWLNRNCGQFVERFGDKPVNMMELWT